MIFIKGENSLWKLINKKGKWDIVLAFEVCEAVEGYYIQSWSGHSYSQCSFFLFFLFFLLTNSEKCNLSFLKGINWFGFIIFANSHYFIKLKPGWIIFSIWLVDERCSSWYSYYKCSLLSFLLFILPKELEWRQHWLPKFIFFFKTKIASNLKLIKNIYLRTYQLSRSYKKFEFSYFFSW